MRKEALSGLTLDRQVEGFRRLDDQANGSTPWTSFREQLGAQGDTILHQLTQAAAQGSEGDPTSWRKRGEATLLAAIERDTKYAKAPRNRLKALGVQAEYAGMWELGILSLQEGVDS